VITGWPKREASWWKRELREVFCYKVLVCEPRILRRVSYDIEKYIGTEKGEKITRIGLPRREILYYIKAIAESRDCARGRQRL
jgi:hypothetical protein